MYNIQASKFNLPAAYYAAVEPLSPEVATITVRFLFFQFLPYDEK